METNYITGQIVDSCFRIHKELGPGLFESVYEEILAHELISKGFYIERQLGLPVVWKNLKMEQGFRIDILVESKIIVEIKSVELISSVHKMQLLTYLRLSNLRFGLLINFNEALLKDGISRIVNGY